MSFEVVLFYVMASFSLSTALMVISALNPVHSVLFLILAFCNASGLLLLLEAEFLALIFVIVYVGAIAVLFLFVVMMLNVKSSELSESVSRYLPVGGLIAIIFMVEVSIIVTADLVPTLITGQRFLGDLLNFRPDLVQWSSMVDSITTIQLMGQVLYTDFVHSFLVSSMILLVSMIGAIVLTLHKRINVRKQDIFKQVSSDFESAIVNLG